MPDHGLKMADVVNLKSGGLPMTITALEESNAFCDWFIDGLRKCDRFAYEELESTQARTDY